MQIKFLGYRKRGQWVLTWVQPVTKRRTVKSFATEQEAEDFAGVLHEVAQREKAIMRRARCAKATGPKITVKELFARFFAVAYDNPVTLKHCRYHADQVETLLGGRMAAQLTKPDVFNFLTAQRLRGIAQVTANRRYSILRAAINWAVRSGILENNPCAGLRLPKAPLRRSAPPTPTEARAILRNAAPHVQRVIVLGMYIGARIGPSELFRLTWADIDLDGAVIRLPSADKNDRTDGRDIPIRRVLRPVLRAWRDEDALHGYGHVIHWNGRPVGSISKAWHGALKKAGVCRRIRPYDLRHAYATYSLGAGADLKTVADLMGHTDARMVLQTYQHVLESHKRAAVEVMPDILRLKGAEDGKMPGYARD